jgi:hypothetical protein
MKRAYFLAILLLFGVFPLNPSSGDVYIPGTMDFSFSTPINLMLKTTNTFTDDDAKEFRTEQLDDDGDGTVTTDELNAQERYMTSNYALSTLPVYYSLNDVFPEPEHVLVDINDVFYGHHDEGPANSTKQFDISWVLTYTFDVSPDLDEYTFTTWYDVEGDPDGFVPFKVTVPEGYKITKVDGVKNSDLSGSDRTITVQPIDNIVVVFEKENSLLSSTSLIPALISIGIIAIFLLAITKLQHRQ